MNKFLKLLLVLPFLYNSSALYAVSFTADAVQIRGTNISHARMYWLDGNVRFEYTEDGVAMAQIFDNRNKKIIWLDNENKLFLEKEMPESEKVISANKSKKTTDPCKQFADAECLFLKKAEINDRATDKWLITLNNNGNDFHIFQWIDVEYKNILRQENSDGSGLSVDVQDNQEMNGRKVRKLTMVAFSASGEQKKGTQWYDNEMDIVIKQEYQSDVIDELKNIKIGKVSKSLFEIPENYVLFQDEVKDIPEQITGKEQQIVFDNSVAD